MKRTGIENNLQLQGRVRDIRPSLAPFFLFLILGFLCLFAAHALRPNPDLKWVYDDDPAYAVESRLISSVQTFSNTIAAGNARTISQISSIAHNLSHPPQQHSNHRKLPK